eukprot:CAMPEP_0172320274 /NCGR_PEP_ID=MMETSP1058-20130122/40164_1 /TAXON_ID=83371 /ORGANISM="Detonula confervacea, Strain CCMP 353" /LENGTH=402 /DNA_ID=CAMNT_0013035505 /DNA_START=114 /DNA_END=1322 /DNA_ORIENTATION=+
MALESSPAFKHDVIDQSSCTKTLLVNGRQSSFDSSTKCNLNRGFSKVSHETDSIWISGDYDSLPEVPMFYPIERTSTVVDCCDSREIARRITGCLQKLSITAKFNASEASLFAETLDYTKFHIRLYKSNNINNKGILVELQRVDGDSFNFVKYVQAILASARGENINGRKATARRSSLNYIPSSIISCHLDKRRQPEECNAEYMMHIEELLKKDRSDAVLLGIESLVLLTDQDRSQVSLSVAEAVLNGNGHSVIKDFVRKCIHCPHLTLSPEDNAFDYASWQCCDRLHNAALAVLGNSLKTASDAKSSKLLGFLLESEEWMGHSGIVDALLSELSHAEDRSHDAYHAARCLNTLLDSSPEMKMALIERGLPRLMKISQAVGQRRHSLLARECDAALFLMADE